MNLCTFIDTCELNMDMSTANVTQTPKDPKDPNAQAEPKARKPRPPKAPKDPNAQPEPKARKPRPPKAPKAPKPDITHAGPIRDEVDEPTPPPFVTVYSETIEDDVPTKQSKTRSSGLDLSMANLRI